jgi:ABC transport system ATP-binding/permease protein
MNILSADNLSKAFGDKVLFSGVNIGLAEGQKLGLIARNGAGKSTLLDILARRLEADEGQVVLRRGTRLVYLEQDPFFPPGLSAEDCLLMSETRQNNAIRDYHHALHMLRVEDNEQHRRLLEQASLAMDSSSAWDFEGRVKEMLGKLDLDKCEGPASSLSGGQRKKLALARVLLEEADLLLLDEPTNHLDIEMIEWLEGFLSRARLSLIVVTHDRYFLDNVCDEIIELDKGTGQRYKGDYAWYLEKKAEREEADSQSAEKERNLYKRELDWVRRMPQARTTKSKSRTDSFYDLEAKVKSRITEKDPSFAVESKRLGKKIIELNHIAKSYGDKVLIAGLTYIFKRGERIGLVGPNGCGKTTLLRMLAGEIRPDKGHISQGSTVEMAFFRQEHLKGLDDRRVIDIVKDVAEEILMGKRRLSPSQFLHHFRFNAVTQQNYFANLSGGEKRRLHLLLALARNPNFLLLDEPTNDLDVFTLTLLEEFLRDFDGCLVMASHDRAFLDRLAEHVFVFEEGGKMRDFPGNYSQYREKRQLELRRKALIEIAVEPEEPAAKRRAQKVKPTWAQLREFESLESEIASLEAEQLLVNMKLSGSDTDHIALMELSSRAAELIHAIEAKTVRWLELGELIASLEE